MVILKLYKDNAEVFINLETVQRMSFEKKEELRQSDREVKIQFTDGSTGIYVGHRDTAKALSSMSVSLDKIEA